MNLQLGSWREGFFYARELDLLLGLGCVEELNHIHNLRDAESYLSDILFNVSYAKAAEVLKKLGKKTNQFDDQYPLTTYLKSKFSNEEQLPDSAYQWMEDNPKACAFCYQFLYKTSTLSEIDVWGEGRKRLNPKYTRQPLCHTNKYPTLHQFLKYNDSIRTTKIRSRVQAPKTINDLSECIKSSLRCSEIDVFGQQYIVDLLAEAWTYSSQEKHCVKFDRWLEKNNKKKILWFKEYAFKRFPNYPLSWFPTNDQDYYYVFHANFHFLSLIRPSDAILFFKDARSSWNQFNFRNKSIGSKSRSISMSERTNKRLDWLAKNKDQKINAVIKELIDLEFEHLGGPSKL